MWVIAVKPLDRENWEDTVPCLTGIDVPQGGMEQVESLSRGML